MGRPMVRYLHSRLITSRDAFTRTAGYASILFVTLTLACILKVFVVDAVMIPSHSMEETLLVGDYVLVNKLVKPFPPSSGVAGAGASFAHLPGIRSIEAGDVVV